MNDNEVLQNCLHSYKECFEAMNELLTMICSRIELTDEEKEQYGIIASKYKNMIYHVRKWKPGFKIPER